MSNELRHRFSLLIAHRWLLNALCASTVMLVLVLQAVQMRNLPQEQPSLLGQPVDTLPPVNDRGWGGSFTHHGPVAVTLYLLLFEVFGLIGWPIATRVFGRFPDRGWGVAKLLGWLVCAYVAWLGASVKILSFTLPWCIAIVVGATVLTGTVVWWNRAILVAHLRAAWRTMIAAEVMTLAGFTLFLLFRLNNPDLWQTYWGGEKPFELAQLNAILRSAHFPPYDPWYAGGYINYYYWGGYLHAFAMKLTGVAPEVAFNIALPMTMALVWGAAFSVGSALWMAVRSVPGRDGDAIKGGVAGALAVAFLGNLDGAGQVVQLLREGVPLGEIGQQFSFWQSARVIPGTINEFPFFSGLWADLHAHVIGLPFTILIIGIALSIALHWESKRFVGSEVALGARLRGVPWVSLLLAALVGGALYCINTWDFPTAVVLIGLGLLVGLRQAEPRWPVAATLAAIGAAAVAVMGYLLFLPFFQHFKTLYGAVAWTRHPSSLGDYLIIFGFFLAVITFGVATTHSLSDWPTTLSFNRQSTVIYSIALLATLVALLTRHIVLIVTLPLLGLLAVLWVRAERHPGRRMLYSYTLAGIGLTSVVEVVYLVDGLGGGSERMNTVFKFYFQAWTLLALAAVGYVSLIMDRWTILLPVFRKTFIVLVGLGILATLMYPVFGTQSRLLQRMPPSPLHAGLDGYAWMETGSVLSDYSNNTDTGARVPFMDDLALIDWMNAHIRGTPVIAEASFGPYRGNGSRISSATGFPTIIGWESHESQQRDPTPLPKRVEDVRTLYTSTAELPIRAVLARYRVQYIVVGELERKIKIAPNQTYATDAGLATLTRMAQEGTLRVAWHQRSTILYEVTERGAVGEVNR